MASSTQFRRIYLIDTKPVSIDLRNCKKVMIQNTGRNSIYLGSTNQTLAASMPEMFTLLPRDTDAYREQTLIFENPNQLFDGPIFVRLANSPSGPTEEHIEIAKFGCV